MNYSSLDEAWGHMPIKNLIEKKNISNNTIEHFTNDSLIDKINKNPEKYISLLQTYNKYVTTNYNTTPKGTTILDKIIKKYITNNINLNDERKENIIIILLALVGVLIINIILN